MPPQAACAGLRGRAPPGSLFARPSGDCATFGPPAPMRRRRPPGPSRTFMQNRHLCPVNTTALRIAVSVINDVRVDARVHKICTSLRRAGHHVTCFARPTTTFRWQRPPDYHIRWIQPTRPAGKKMYLNFNYSLYRHLKAARWDLLWANDLDTLLPMWRHARRHHVPLIYDTHEYFTGMAELAGRPLTRWLWKRLERFLFPRLRTIVTVNPSVARRYRREYGKPLHILRNLPLRQDRRPRPVGQWTPPFRLIYQGALAPGRGLDLIIEAMAHLPDDVILDVVGAGPLRPSLETLAQRHGVTHRVFFHGLVPFFELPSYTARAHLGLSVESPHFTNSALSLPNKLLDYLNQGLPVIVTDLPEHRRIVNRYRVGLVLKEYTPQALAEAVRRIKEDPARYRQMARRAIAAADKDLTWEAQEPHLLKIVADAAGI